MPKEKKAKSIKKITDKRSLAIEEFKPLSGREFPRFSAIKTFFRLPLGQLNENFDVAIAGVPFDGGVSYRPGPRFAPSRVREASSLGRGFHWGRGLGVFETLKVADVGDVSVVPIDLGQTYSRVTDFAEKILSSGKRLISCGGDHSLTLPLLRAFRKHYKQPLAFIHFDAHLDTYPAAWGCEYHHGSFARHAVEEGLIDPENYILIGARGPLAGEDDLAFVRKHKIKVFTVDHVRSGSLKAFVKSLPKFSNKPTYLSFDVDSLDPAFAPGTGTPVIGGLTSYEIQIILRNLQVKNLVGADVVEFSPPYDHADITALVAVDVIFEALCMMARSRD